jgi:hypothetical protein
VGIFSCPPTSGLLSRSADVDQWQPGSGADLAKGRRSILDTSTFLCVEPVKILLHSGEDVLVGIDLRGQIIDHERSSPAR